VAHATSGPGTYEPIQALPTFSIVKDGHSRLALLPAARRPQTTYRFTADSVGFGGHAVLQWGYSAQGSPAYRTSDVLSPPRNPPPRQATIHASA